MAIRLSETKNNITCNCNPFVRDNGSIADNVNNPSPCHAIQTKKNRVTTVSEEVYNNSFILFNQLKKKKRKKLKKLNENIDGGGYNYGSVAAKVRVSNESSEEGKQSGGSIANCNQCYAYYASHIHEFLINYRLSLAKQNKSLENHFSYFYFHTPHT